MNSGFLDTFPGQRGYAPMATILLLALGIGAAAFLYFALKRADAPTAGGPGAPEGQEQIEHRMLEELGKSGNRSFSEEQAALLERELSPQKGESIAIECQLGDVQGCYLALEIDLIFEASGWIVEEFLFAAKGTPGETAVLFVKDESILARAERLSRLFSAAGLKVTTKINSGQSYNLKILVPSKNAQAGQKYPPETDAHAPLTWLMGGLLPRLEETGNPGEPKGRNDPGGGYGEEHDGRLGGLY